MVERVTPACERSGLASRQNRSSRDRPDPLIGRPWSRSDAQRLARPQPSGHSALVIRELQRSDVRACAAILGRLSDWFGDPVSNANYVAALDHSPGFVASVRAVRGFLVLEKHDHGSAEILVMGVDPEWHRNGLGRALVAAAEEWCKKEGVRWLHVKTRGPSTYDDAYERTRQFYF